MNYHLETTQLKAASDSPMKNLSFDLIELKPIGKYKNFKAAAKSVNLPVKGWKEKHLEMEKEGMDKNRDREPGLREKEGKRPGQAEEVVLAIHKT
jgi:hypothetical protein